MLWSRQLFLELSVLLEHNQAYVYFKLLSKSFRFKFHWKIRSIKVHFFFLNVNSILFYNCIHIFFLHFTKYSFYCFITALHKNIILSTFKMFILFGYFTWVLWNVGGQATYKQIRNIQSQISSMDTSVSFNCICIIMRSEFWKQV